SANQYKNILGIFPKEWRLPLTYRRGNDKKETLVRLMGNIDTAVGGQPDQPMPRPATPPGRPPRPGEPSPGGGPHQPPADAPAKKLYVEKKGYANYYFNKLETDKLMAAFTAVSGSPSAAEGTWTADG